MKKNSLEESLISLIRLFLKHIQAESQFNEEIRLEVPKIAKFGDISTNVALRLSRILKRNPKDIAIELAVFLKKGLKDIPLGNRISDIRVEGGGFVNFFLKNEHFYECLGNILLEAEGFGKDDIGKAKPVLIEFVSANPTGPLSVAHARQAVVGDVLANIMQALGYKVTREYYLNDEGNQINILGRSVELRMRELAGEKIEFPEDHYKGEYIYEIAKEVESRTTHAGAWVPRVESLSDYAADYILKIIKQELSDFGVKFDSWFSQKALGKSGKIKEVLGLLKEKGFIYEEEGAVWFKSTQFGDDKNRVVIKSDGSYTYLAPDIAYHEEKYRRGFQWLINLWGPDHHGYINRLKASAQALGHDAKSLDIIIVQLATIFRNGVEVKMSTRQGQYITLREVLDEVGADASRFFFLMRRVSSHLDFDLELAKKQTPENPVYYVQYAHARINSILKKVEDESINEAAIKQANFSLLKEKEELDLLRTLMQFPFVLRLSLEVLDPSNLTNYLQELAEAFHKFYDQHRVLGEDKELTLARLGLIDAVRIVLSNGLALLGISKPLVM